MGTFQKYDFHIYRRGETFQAVRPFSHDLATVTNPLALQVYSDLVTWSDVQN